MSHFESPTLSVCICTYNRANYLAELLVLLKDADWHDGDELIVIDNRSTDHTAQVIEAAKAYDLPLKAQYEPQQGLSNARNTGLAAAGNECVVFIDNDILPEEGFLTAYRAAFSESPSVGFFGGRISIDWPDGSPPSWWLSQDYSLLNGLLGNYQLGNEQRALTPSDRLPYGANFALRKSCIDRVGQFDPALGVSGGDIGRGEESDYFERAQLLGFSGLYVPKAHVRHRFQADRLTLIHLLRYGLAKGRLCPPRKRTSAYWAACSQLLRGGWQALRGRRANAYQCLIMIGVHLAEAR